MEEKTVITKEKIDELIRRAISARAFSYAPYSNFMVGAAVLTEKGQIFSGCNIENASYGATNCAERTAIFKAVSEGHKKIEAIAIVGGMKDADFVDTYPCGICRQVLSEFADPDLPVILAVSESQYRMVSLSELLPYAFDLTNTYL